MTDPRVPVRGRRRRRWSRRRPAFARQPRRQRRHALAGLPDRGARPPGRLGQTPV